MRIGPARTPDGHAAEQAARCPNFTARRDESLAYDWDVRPGRVSSRVALLLRAAERQPAVGPIYPPPHEFGGPDRHLKGRASTRGRVRVPGGAELAPDVASGSPGPLGLIPFSQRLSLPQSRTQGCTLGQLA